MKYLVPCCFGMWMGVLLPLFHIGFSDPRYWLLMAGSSVFFNLLWSRP